MFCFSGLDVFTVDHELRVHDDNQSCNSHAALYIHHQPVCQPGATHGRPGATCLNIWVDEDQPSFLHVLGVPDIVHHVSGRN